MSFESATGQHTISIQQVQHILLGAKGAGRDTAALLRRAQIPASFLESPLARVTQRQYAALMFALQREFKDELWGLCSSPVPIGSFAHVCRGLIRCRTLGEAMAFGLRSYRLLLQDFTPRLDVRPDYTTLCLLPRRPLTAALTYAMRSFSFLSYGLASWLVARRLPLTAVLYPPCWHPAQTDTSLLFQAPVRDSSRRLGWVLDSRWLELPVVQNEQSLQGFMRQAPASLLVRYRDQTSVTERIRRILRYHLMQEAPSLSEIGKQLAMTPQTLRRRLNDEGQGFRAIKDDLRRDAAIEFLALPELTLQDVASRVGFSEASTFHRAFKAWTGVAPGEYRRAHFVGAERGCGVAQTDND